VNLRKDHYHIDLGGRPTPVGVSPSSHTGVSSLFWSHGGGSERLTFGVSIVAGMPILLTDYTPASVPYQTRTLCDWYCPCILRIPHPFLPP